MVKIIRLPITSTIPFFLTQQFHLQEHVLGKPKSHLINIETRAWPTRAVLQFGGTCLHCREPWNGSKQMQKNNYYVKKIRLKQISKGKHHVPLEYHLCTNKIKLCIICTQKKEWEDLYPKVSVSLVLFIYLLI